MGMTNEEAIAELKEDIDLYIPTNGTIEEVDRELSDGRLITALEMGIKALEKQKTGKWIDCSDEGYVECPFCGHATTCEDNIDELHYCFYCGARMEESEESE